MFWSLWGDILDGIISETEKNIKPANQNPINVAKYFKSTGVEIVLCLLPSGADNAIRFYANEAIKAGCAFINATPTNVATDKEYAKKFHDAGLPLIGDDLQDQFGATILHKMILQQMLDLGIDIKESYALDVGGGAESLNTIQVEYGENKEKVEILLEILKINRFYILNLEDNDIGVDNTLTICTIKENILKNIPHLPKNEKLRDIYSIISQNDDLFFNTNKLCILGN